MYIEDTLEMRAKEFASKAHFGQKRKYNGVMYITHPESVVARIKTVPHTPAMIAAGWLHDVQEDCGVTNRTIRDLFGYEVSSLVDWLSDVSKPSDGNRAARKKLDLEHIKKAPPEAKTIKLADILDNIWSIVIYDPDFASIYIPEKEATLKVLLEGNRDLWWAASDEILAARWLYAARV